MSNVHELNALFRQKQSYNNVLCEPSISFVILKQGIENQNFTSVRPPGFRQWVSQRV